MAYLRLFGGASLEREGVACSGPEAQRHRLALLALLACARPHGLQRDKLVALLWPERPPERARNLLNQAIHHLRRALGSGVIVSSGGELRLDPAVLPCDVVEFEEALDAGRLGHAVGRYHGPFLDGFHLGESLDFQHWADGERVRLAERFREAVERLAEDAEARGDVEEAVASWRRRAGEDPLNSRVALKLARALEETGDVAGALRHLRVHQRLLEEELGIEPRREVRELTATLEAGEDERGAPTGAPEPATPAEEAPASTVETEAPTTVEASAAAGRAPRKGSASEPREPGIDPPLRPAPARGSGGGSVGWPPRAWALVGLVALAAAAAGILRAGGPGAGSGAAGSEGDGAPPSVVVLPFENLGPDEDAHFAAGVTAELTAGLARVPGLSVVARSSALRYADEAGLDIRAVAEELGVDYVVTGSVRWEMAADQPERVRITPRLVRVPEGRHVWAGTYDRAAQEVFDLQTEITEAIIRELDANIPEARRYPLAGRATDHLEAYDHYLQGNAYIARQFSDEAARAAIAQYERAVELDPEFVAAWRRLIQTRVWLGWVFDDDEEAPKAEEDLERLLALGVDHPDVHLARGWYLYYGERRYAEAREAFEAVRESRPGDAEVLRVIGFLEQRIEAPERALATMREALELSPRDAELAYGIGQMLVRMGRYEEAPAYYDIAFSLAPDQDVGFLHPGFERLQVAVGDTAEARRVRERARELGGDAWGGGRAELYSRDFPGALDRLRGHPPASEFGKLPWYDNLADLHGRLGHDDRRRLHADSLLATARRFAPESWDRPRTQGANAGWIYAGLARIHRGEPDAGLELVRRGLRQEEAFEDRLVEPLLQGLAARAFVRAGRPDAALDLLEAPGVVPGAFSAADLRLDPEWDPLRDDARFRQLLEPE